MLFETEREHNLANVHKQEFDLKKAMNALVCVTERIQDTASALRTIYFADRLHLIEYGNTIYGERYLALQSGPVPETLWKLVYTGGWVAAKYQHEFDRCFEMPCTRRTIKPLVSFDWNSLVVGDKSCLEAAIWLFETMTPSKIRVLARSDSAYLNAMPETDEIDLRWMAMTTYGVTPLLVGLANERRRNGGYLTGWVDRGALACK